MSQEFFELTKIYYHRLAWVDDFKKVQDQILKFAPTVPEEKTYDYYDLFLERLKGKIEPATSGHGSIDLIVPGCPKSYWENMKKMKESFCKLKRRLSQAATRLSTDLGFKLDSGFLSTGCKAALETVRCGEKEIIDLIECGMNARDCIISNCKTAAFLFQGQNAGSVITQRMIWWTFLYMESNLHPCGCCHDIWRKYKCFQLMM